MNTRDISSIWKNYNNKKIIINMKKKDKTPELSYGQTLSRDGKYIIDAFGPMFYIPIDNTKTEICY